MTDYGPFDPDELVRWAENYGHPELWAKKAQALHGQNEKMRDALTVVAMSLMEALEVEGHLRRGSCLSLESIARNALKAKDT